MQKTTLSPENNIYLLFVLFLVLVNTSTYGQNGKFDLRLVQESVDCATRKVTFVAQIKASSPDSTFIMGSSSLPFTFSDNALANPVLTSIDSYSGGRYGTLTLNAQLPIITLSIIYSGTAPFNDTPNVISAWTDIAHITFDIPAQSDGCYLFAVNGPTAFPSVEAFQVVVAAGVAAEAPALAGTLTNATGCAFAANLPTATILGDTTINSGTQATLKVSFSGPPPTSITVAGIMYNNLSQSPLMVNVFPDQTTIYTIDSVSNACGKGIASGSATVTIAAVAPQDTIATLAIAADTVCRGSSVTVDFTTNGNFNSANEFKVQLSDATGSNYTDIATVSTATPGPLNAIIPVITPAGTGYRLRVVATGPSVVGTPSEPFTVAASPTATLTGNATITSGNPANLTVQLTGKARWTVTLSDNSVFTTSSNPLTIPVSPTITTTYSLKSVTGGCGNGTVSGSAIIIVQPGGEPCRTLCVPVTAVIINK